MWTAFWHGLNLFGLHRRLIGQDSGSTWEPTLVIFVALLATAQTERLIAFSEGCKLPVATLFMHSWHTGKIGHADREILELEMLAPGSCGRPSPVVRMLHQADSCPAHAQLVMPGADRHPSKEGSFIHLGWIAGSAAANERHFGARARLPHAPRRAPCPVASACCQRRRAAAGGVIK